MSHSVGTRAGATLHWVFMLFGSAGRVTVGGRRGAPKRDRITGVCLLALRLSTVQECVCVCVPDKVRVFTPPPHPTKSDRCNDPTGADLICGGGVSLIRSRYRQRPARRLNSRSC